MKNTLHQTHGLMGHRPTLPQEAEPGPLEYSPAKKEQSKTGITFYVAKQHGSSNDKKLPSDFRFQRMEKKQRFITTNNAGQFMVH